MKTVRSALGKRLEFLRKEKGYSKFRLSAESGVDRSFLIDISQGNHAPNINTLAKLAKTLDVGMKELFEFSEEPPTTKFEFPED